MRASVRAALANTASTLDYRFAEGDGSLASSVLKGPIPAFAMASGYTYTDASGNLQYCSANLFLNSATLSTQNVTVVAAPHTVSLYGTGKIDFTGTYTGTLQGTGATDRVSVTFTPTAGTLTCTVTGSVTSAQCERSATVSPYMPTVATAATRTVNDYDPVTLLPRGMPLFEARTNSIRNNMMIGAVAGTPGTLPTNWVFAINTTTGLTKSIVGTGTENGIAYCDFRVNGTATGAGSLQIDFEATNQIAALTAQVWTQSLYWKLAGGSLTGLSNFVANTTEWTSVGSGNTFVRSNYGTLNAPTSAALSSQRQTSVVTLAGGATTAFVDPIVKINIADGAAIDITLRIGMPQLELGAFATPVIPNYGAAATRAAPTMSTTDLGWFNPSEGTFVSSAVYGVTIPTTQAFQWQMSDGGSTNYIGVYKDAGGIGYITERVRVSSSDQVFLYSTPTAPASGTSVKTAFAYKANDFAGVSAGGSVFTDSAGSIPALNTICVGGSTYSAGVMLNGYLSSLTYHPKRLSNALVQRLSS